MIIGRILTRCRKSALVAGVLSVLFTTTHASAELRITTYNTKKRPSTANPNDTDAANWIGALTAISNSQTDAGVARAPDIIALQEIPYTSQAFQELGQAPFDSPANIATLLNNLNGVSTYSHMTGSYGDGWNTQGYVWNTATVELLQTQMVSIGTRPAVRLKFRPVGYTSPGAEFYVYNVHLKAYPDSESRRYSEAQALRSNSDNGLGNGANVIYAGDFNFTEGVNGERAYGVMLSPGPGKAVDPANGAEGYFDGTYPSTGGGGSRLDYQFVTEELVDGEGLDLMNGGYKVVGPTYIPQLNRYDVVPSALKFASDHLPVIADYQVPAWQQASVASVPGAVIVGANASVNVTVENIAPATVVAGADELDYAISGTGVVIGAASGIDPALGGGQMHAIALDTSLAGNRSGQLLVNSSSPAVQNGSYSQAVQLNVLDHSNGSFATATDVNLLALDLGSFLPGTGIQSSDFEIHNLLSTAGYTAALDVDSIFASGDTGALTTDLVATSILAGGSASFQASLVTSFAQGLFNATYTIGVSDQDLLGAIAGTDLVLQLTGYVGIDGDVNLDRKVDAGDLNLLLSHYGQSSGADWGSGDFTGDGAVTSSDLNLLLTNYGVQLGGMLDSLQSVPEPSSLMLIGCAIATCMTWRRRSLAALGLVFMVSSSIPAQAETPVRIATYNTSMYRASSGALAAELSTPGSTQPSRIAEMIQRVHPDVLFLNEFDYDPTGKSAADFQKNYLGVSQNGLSPVQYPYVYTAASNTGIQPEDVHGPAADFDFNHNGSNDQADDAFGFGEFPGQYGMLVLSKYPIAFDKIRTFQNFLWKDMPGALLPDDPTTPGTPADWYSPAELDVFRLSSKNHWDVPIMIDGKAIHLLVSHPTPPVFDDEEDRNGTRNHDEIRFWADYIAPGKNGYIYDDQEFVAAGRQAPDITKGGLAPGESFVILGDLNADPNRGDGYPGAANQLTESPYINNSFVPMQEMPIPGIEPTTTSTFGLRADYVLPSRDLHVTGSAVVWPNRRGDPQVVASSASDHLPVYVDFVIVPEPSTVVMATFGLLGVKLGACRYRLRPLRYVRGPRRILPCDTADPARR